MSLQRSVPFLSRQTARRSHDARRKSRKTSLFQSIIQSTLAFVLIAVLAPAGVSSVQAGVESHDGRLKIGGDILAPDLTPFLSALGAAIQTTDEAGTPLYVELNSDGGDIETAFSIASALSAARKSGRIIHVEVPEGGRCNSACVVIFAAGGQRKAAPDSEFLLHGVSYAGLSDNPAIAAVRRRYVENFHKAIEGADWHFGQFVRRHGIIENDLNMTFSGRQLYEAFGSFITSLNTTPGN